MVREAQELRVRGPGTRFVTHRTFSAMMHLRDEAVADASALEGASAVRLILSVALNFLYMMVLVEDRVQNQGLAGVGFPASLCVGGGGLN